VVVDAPGLERQRELSALTDDLSVALGTANASAAVLVEAIARNLEADMWEREECRSPEHWLAVRCGVSTARAHRLVRIARRIHEFPRVARLFAQGQVTEDHLDVIALHAHASHDLDLEIAGCCTVGQLRRFIATLPVPDPEPVEDDDEDNGDDDDAAAKAAANRAAFGWGDDGRFRGGFDLDAELGSLVDQALRSGRRTAYRDRHGVDAGDDADLAAITAVDALEIVARGALDALDPSTARGGSPSPRHQVFVHLDADDPDRARINLGPLLPRSVRDQILCDAELRAVLWRGGRPVGLGRKHRVADTLLRKLIEDRDGGCRVPGCDRRGYLHIHHLVHWPDGGPTDPHNLVALCTEHHRQVHTGRLRLVGNPETDDFDVVDRHGRPLPRPAPGPPGPAPATAEPYTGPHRERFDRRTDIRWF
jgi:hypothetical protein